MADKKCLLVTATPNIASIRSVLRNRIEALTTRHCDQYRSLHFAIPKFQKYLYSQAAIVTILNKLEESQSNAFLRGWATSKIYVVFFATNEEEEAAYALGVLKGCAASFINECERNIGRGYLGPVADDRSSIESFLNRIVKPLGDYIDEQLRDQEIAEQDIEMKKQRIPPTSRGNGLLFSVFVILLLAVIGLVLIFASGRLRFGLEGPVVYLIYVLVGLLAAVLCYGILNSTGQLSGKIHGINVQLGGAIVVAVIIVVGAVYYEKMVRQDTPFEVRAYLYEKAQSELVSANGVLAIHLGEMLPTANINPDGTALFQGIPRQWAGKKVLVSLTSTSHELAKAPTNIELVPKSAIYIRLRKKLPLATTGAN